MNWKVHKAQSAVESGCEYHKFWKYHKHERLQTVMVRTSPLELGVTDSIIARAPHKWR